MYNGFLIKITRKFEGMRQRTAKLLNHFVIRDAKFYRRVLESRDLTV
jgi:hypothetical protein